MNKKSSSKKKIPVSNYVKLVLGVAAAVFIAVLLRNWYVSSRDYELNIPIITETLLSEINSDEVYSYIRENENAILYIGVVNDSGCRKFEEAFNEVVRSRSLEDTITYLNITKTGNKNNFIKEFNKFYDAKLLGYPSLIIFEEGEVKATLTVKIGEELSVDKAVRFLDDNSVVSTDL